MKNFIFNLLIKFQLLIKKLHSYGKGFETLCKRYKYCLQIEGVPNNGKVFHYCYFSNHLGLLKFANFQKYENNCFRTLILGNGESRHFRDCRFDIWATDGIPDAMDWRILCYWDFETKTWQKEETDVN